MYQLPTCNVQSHEYNLVHNTVSPAEMISVLRDVVAPRLDRGEYAGLDVEGSNLNPHALSYDLTGIGIALATDSKSGFSWYCDLKYPHRYMSGDQLEYLTEFMQKYEKQLVVYNCSYELKAFWAKCGRPFYFTDCRAYISASGRFGSLKENAQELVNAPEWEDENSDFVGAFDDSAKMFRKWYADDCRTARTMRIACERSTTDLLNWTKCIPDYDKIRSELDYPSVVKAVENCDTSELTRQQLLLVECAKVGATEDEVFQSMMYDISSGWGGAPTRSLSPYCGADCFYTLQLFNLLRSDPRIANAAPPLQDEIMVGGVMESFGINWDDNVAAELEGKYAEQMSDALVYLIKGMNIEMDALGWMQELMDKLQARELPFTYEVRNLKGGYTYEKNSDANIPTAGQMEKWKDTLFIDDDKFVGLPTLVPPQYYLTAIQEEINHIRDHELAYWNGVTEGDDDFEDKDKSIASCERRIYNREQKLELIRSTDNNQWYGKEITPEIYDTLTPPICLKYTYRKGQPLYIDKTEWEVNTHFDVIDTIKSTFFNPGSNTDEQRKKFWDMYLTPRMMTANMMHNLIKHIEMASMLDYFMDKELKDPDTEEVTVVESVRKIVTTDGTIKEYRGSLIDKMDLQSTMQRLMEFAREIPSSSSVPYNLIGASKALLHGLSDEEVAAHRERMSTYALQNQWSQLITECISNLKTWTGQGSGFDTDTIEWQHKVHQNVLGFNIDDQSTWSPEYWLLHKFRIYKKCAKNDSTYVNGNSLGRGSVIMSAKVPQDRNIPVRESTDLHGRSEINVSQALIPTRPVDYYWSCDKSDVDIALPDHRIVLETDFFTLGTETRRWRSRNHTVPANSELRRAYRPHYDGWLRVHEDYSGAELCVVAAITNCKAMLHAFMTGGDVHMNTACGVFQTTPEHITDMMRRYCKIITFRLLYGSTVEGLAAELMISLKRAQDMVDGFMATYPELEEYIRWSRAHAREHGWVPSITGAPINIDKYSSSIDQTSINYRIQASSTNLAGSGIGRTWKQYYKMGMPWIPESFTHDSIDASIHPMFHPLHIFLSKRIAEDDNVEMYNAPMRMDFEVGTDGYYICGVKNQSVSLYSGLSENDPIVIPVHGWDKSVNQLVDAYSRFFNVEVEITKSKPSTIPLADLWIPKRSYSTTFGDEVQDQAGKLIMTYRKDVPEFAHLMKVMSNPYVEETHNILLDSFRGWKTHLGGEYGQHS